jgi:hypothetical protein
MEDDLRLVLHHIHLPGADSLQPTIKRKRGVERQVREAHTNEAR